MAYDAYLRHVAPVTASLGLGHLQAMQRGQAQTFWVRTLRRAAVTIELCFGQGAWEKTGAADRRGRDEVMWHASRQKAHLTCDACATLRGHSLCPPIDFQVS